MKMKITEQYKAWRIVKIHKWAQWYADLVIKRLKESKGEMEFNFWMSKGHTHDSNMISKYDIYLD